MGWREETDEEFAARHEQTQKQAQAREARERKEFERLATKFKT